MSTCTICGKPTNRGITASRTARVRCLICDVALNPPPLPPRLERQRARRRVYEAMTRRARGARQISRGRPGGDNAG